MKPVPLPRVLYRLSRDERPLVFEVPRIPKNWMTLNGYEDATVPRICCCPTVGSCLTALSENLEGKTLFAYRLAVQNIRAAEPSADEVPDVGLTGEVWILDCAVFLPAFEVTVTETVESGMKYRYGTNETAVEYCWNYDLTKTF